jgi:hypothetical protein
MGIIGDFEFNVKSFSKEFEISFLFVSFRICFSYSNSSEKFSIYYVSTK